MCVSCGVCLHVHMCVCVCNTSVTESQNLGPEGGHINEVPLYDMLDTYVVHVLYVCNPHMKP